MLFVSLAATVSVGMAAYTFAASNDVEVTTKGSETCISSNGVPDHDVGSNGFNRARVQDQSYCFPSDPVKTNQKTTRAQIIGVMLNGIPIRPNTAEFYDPSSAKGYSRDRSSGWRLSALGNPSIFRTDDNLGHADGRGLYHYHGMPAALIPLGSDTLIGYAADGHEIHYSSDAQPSYMLKSGTRPSGPGGSYDGTYEQDWDYVKGSGNLDECNGATVNGVYVYFATDTYPYFQRCHFGEVGNDFVLRGSQGGRPTPHLGGTRRPLPPGRG